MVNKAAPSVPMRRRAPHSDPQLMFPSTEDALSLGNTVSESLFSWKPPKSGHSRTIQRMSSMVVSTNRDSHKQGARSYQKKQEDVHPEESKEVLMMLIGSPGTEVPSEVPKGLC